MPATACDREPVVGLEQLADEGIEAQAQGLSFHGIAEVLDAHAAIALHFIQGLVVAQAGCGQQRVAVAQFNLAIEVQCLARYALKLLSSNHHRTALAAAQRDLTHAAQRRLALNGKRHLGAGLGRRRGAEQGGEERKRRLQGGSREGLGRSFLKSIISRAH